MELYKYLPLKYEQAQEDKHKCRKYQMSIPSMLDTHTYTRARAQTHNLRTVQPSITLISNLGIRFYPTKCVKLNLKPELI